MASLRALLASLSGTGAADNARVAADQPARDERAVEQLEAKLSDAGPAAVGDAA